MTDDGSTEEREPPRATTALGRELGSLIDQRVLSAEQAERLWQAAEQDHRLAATAGEGTGPGSFDQRHGPTAGTGVLDVLGYVGGTLLLGALIFVGFTLWGDLTRAGRIALAVASCLVPATGGLVLVRSRTRWGLAQVLLALACLAAGFACYQVLNGLLSDDRNLMVSAVVVVLAAGRGIVLLRSAPLYVPAWIGAMGFVPTFLQGGLDMSDQRDAFGYVLAAGFLLVGVVFVVAGRALGRHVAWTLAGLSGWAASGVLLSFQHTYLALATATAVAGALFLGVVRQRLYALAVVGCLIVLSMWPAGLYDILDTALGVALGLVAAGSALIGVAVALSRRRGRPVG